MTETKENCLRKLQTLELKKYLTREFLAKWGGYQFFEAFGPRNEASAQKLADIVIDSLGGNPPAIEGGEIKAIESLPNWHDWVDHGVDHGEIFDENIIDIPEWDIISQLYKDKTYNLWVAAHKRKKEISVFISFFLKPKTSEEANEQYNWAFPAVFLKKF